ncbi:MAG: hypothetical protein Q7K21_06315 [Elusimicrobiota bacterium]|nr:hypothetical protein [Elusimicrobiota bacterium]
MSSFCDLSGLVFVSIPFFAMKSERYFADDKNSIPSFFNSSQTAESIESAVFDLSFASRVIA